MIKYIADFEPQAWQNDYAVQVDAEGPRTWDATAFINADPDLKARVDKQARLKGYYLDRVDLLQEDENAPQWIRDWTGPFTIRVRVTNG